MGKQNEGTQRAKSKRLFCYNCKGFCIDPVYDDQGRHFCGCDCLGEFEERHSDFSWDGSLEEAGCHD